MPADLENYFLHATELPLLPADLLPERCHLGGKQELWGWLWVSCGRVDWATLQVIQSSLLSDQQVGGGHYEESFPVGQVAGRGMLVWVEF